jgi:hypothetical protein
MSDSTTEFLQFLKESMELNFFPGIQQQFKDYSVLILFYQAGGTVVYVGQYLLAITLVIMLIEHLLAKFTK